VRGPAGWVLSSYRCLSLSDPFGLAPCPPACDGWGLLQQEWNKAVGGAKLAAAAVAGQIRENLRNAAACVSDPICAAMSFGGGTLGRGGITRLPTAASQLEHIFANRAGHLLDTPANRKLLLDVADDAATTLGTDQFGNVWSARTLEDGRQAWTQVRNGVLQNGGVNTTPRVFNPRTGLSGGQ
jgi:hypothetical protein